MMKLKRSVLLACALMVPATAMAEAGDWVIRARAVNISPNESSRLGDHTNALLGVGAGSKLEVNDQVIPELDISYYVTKNIALELILALGTRHDVSIKGANGVASENLGSVNLLPPTLTVQWHFRPDQTVDPYVGAGINYTRFMDNGLHSSQVGDIRVERNSWAPAFQAGFDINLKDGWLLNADVKYLWIDTDVKLKDGPKIDSLDINPWVIGFGFGKRF
ncbi:OmpW/AlkL family protein [Methylobacillus flagellatus]|uniref:OmpW n=1 Tax=Methylobacillus flagellatus (strain ATCC 51484 / DSM 6875 / VKM B-1610 / KT) TaxID=265072 RepID=Q1H3P0_METFK|nr:OmpW family outer membrane protein [Methylobacillus flagellatus]ABE48897.1 OmpW [Methylobacillus flagellatus KT]